MGYLIGGAGPDADERKKIVASGKSSLKGMSNTQLRKMRGQAIKDIARFENNQMARKISLNSAYGAVGNQYFRYYKLANAEAITLSGQVSIRWIENKMNQKMNKILKTEGVDYVIASDTDSIYLNLGPLVETVYKDREKTNEGVVTSLNKVFEFEFQPYIESSYQ